MAIAKIIKLETSLGGPKCTEIPYCVRALVAKFFQRNEPEVRKSVSTITRPYRIVSLSDEDVPFHVRFALDQACKKYKVMADQHAE